MAKEYKTSGKGVMVTTASGSVYSLEIVENGIITPALIKRAPYVPDEPRRVYLVTQISGKTTLEHPVIAVSLKGNFMVGNNMDIVISDDIQANDTAQYRYARLTTSEITESRVLSAEPKVVYSRYEESKETHIQSDYPASEPLNQTTILHSDNFER